ncbi:hypothetical protein [Terrarubrum flagellatum]|uniref:hypothetical protein n=1 Tax=Terrirubrum flagellatum TaxID=2895980 RepID=UPI003144ECAB
MGLHPFAIPQGIDDLPQYVFIGLPAFESHNALLLPLAAHELAHAVWRRKNIEGGAANNLLIQMKSIFDHNKPKFLKAFPEYKEGDLVSQQLLDENVEAAIAISLRQAEEIFCDMLALALFGESYVRAFEYILSPGLGAVRRADYPPMSVRVEFLRWAAKEKVAGFISEEFMKEYIERPLIQNERNQFIDEMAQQGLHALRGALWTEVSRLIADANIPRPNSSQQMKCHAMFERGVPHPQPASLADVLNAGWKRFDSIINGDNDDTRRDQLAQLNDMIFKTIEIMEFQLRTQ